MVLGERDSISAFLPNPNLEANGVFSEKPMMKHQLWSGLTAAMLIAGLGTVPSSQAGQTENGDRAWEADRSPESQGEASGVARSRDAAFDEPSDVMKVGEYQSQDTLDSDRDAIAKIQPHELDGRTAATLYVRNIPILTFRGDEIEAEAVEVEVTFALNETKVGEPLDADEKGDGEDPNSVGIDETPERDEPVWRATAIAARINQLQRNGIDAEQIKARWSEERQRYIIYADEQELVEMNSDTLLPESTGDPAEDTLQATNRLRRQLGNAPPLSEIPGKPRPKPKSGVSVLMRLEGWASWYGPGFHGNRSASGEIYNQYALTAAHRNLPFGTRVRVTNLNNGRVVVVRINDRGPYLHNRIIDLSVESARLLGMLQTGVAPVQLEVLGSPRR
jgi:rare lipoprotein A